VGEESMSPEHWLALVLLVPFSSLKLMVGWLEGHPASRNAIPLNLRGFSSGTVGGGGSERNWLTQAV